MTGRVCAGLGALLVLLGIVALTAGRPTIGLTALPGALSSPDLPGVLLRELRVPRLLLGIVAGVSLACAGPAGGAAGGRAGLGSASSVVFGWLSPLRTARPVEATPS